ncbi:uncharacterized protein VTP21DRAFT_2811 [Calcarisporiella thermophila]|uniref:uncharacterized protein n=1 Tax=Calcarisporiella thermophila TaxID=911321 RepID=UPI0037427ACD
MAPKIALDLGNTSLQNSEKGPSRGAVAIRLWDHSATRVWCTWRRGRGIGMGDPRKSPSERTHLSGEAMPLNASRLPQSIRFQPGSFARLF